MIVKTEIRGPGKTAAPILTLALLLFAPEGGLVAFPGFAAAASSETESAEPGQQGQLSGSEQEQQRIKALQEKMMGDPETVEWIGELKNDPSMQEILKDEELLRAIELGDLSRVRQDPKIQALMDSAAFKKILEKNQ